MTKDKEEKTNPWPVIIVVLIILFIISAFSALIIGLFSSDGELSSGNTVIIPITGVISSEEDNSLFGGGSVSSRSIVQQIRQAEEDENINAVIFEINSPGGSPVASHEIAKAIKNMTKPNVAFVREVGASGAYWAASSSDYIIADELSVVGSVGVLSSYLNFYELIDRYNITYERLVAGEYKDIESNYRAMTPEERRIIQFKLEMMQEFFLDDVSNSRNLTRKERAEISSAMYYIGLEAKEINLIDEFGGEEEAKIYLQNRLGIVIEPYRIDKSRGFFDMLTSASAEHGFQVGKGLGQTLVENQNGNIELK
ncbi:MAG: signal peptide peptidase SppA [Candidatus Nanoarchaeia archaeon]